MGILVNIAGLVALVCMIMTIIKMFEHSGVLVGILGIVFCWIFVPFIWGWVNVNKTGQKNIMIIWTICYLISFVFGWQQQMDMIEQMQGE